MSNRNNLPPAHPFPAIRPEITIVESTHKIEQVHCPELRWWFASPKPGDHTMWASYEIDTLKLSSVTDMKATGSARIHGEDCVEIRVVEWAADENWPAGFNPGFIYGRINGDQTEWMAVIMNADGTKVMSTFLDDNFEENWGDCEKGPFYDDGRYRRQADGSYVITDGKGLGAGVYDVTVGDNTFCCLRVLEPDLSVPEGGELVEAYVERSGRTVLFRRYDGRFYRGTDLLEKYPRNNRIVINDAVYVHCDCTGRAHDTITSTAMG